MKLGFNYKVFLSSFGDALICSVVETIHWGLFHFSRKNWPLFWWALRLLKALMPGTTVRACGRLCLMSVAAFNVLTLRSFLSAASTNWNPFHFVPSFQRSATLLSLSSFVRLSKQTTAVEFYSFCYYLIALNFAFRCYSPILYSDESFIQLSLELKLFIFLTKYFPFCNAQSGLLGKCNDFIEVDNASGQWAFAGAMFTGDEQQCEKIFLSSLRFHFFHS